MTKMKKYTATMLRHNPQTGDHMRTVEIEAVSITSARKKAREYAERTIYGSMTVLDVELATETKTSEPTTTKVVLKAFTGMVIAEYNAVVTKDGYTITTKKGEIEFNKDGTQKVDCKNAKFNNHIEIVAEA